MQPENEERLIGFMARSEEFYDNDKIFKANYLDAQTLQNEKIETLKAEQARLDGKVGIIMTVTYGIAAIVVGIAGTVTTMFYKLLSIMGKNIT